MRSPTTSAREVAAIERLEEGVNQLITRAGPTPELSRACRASSRFSRAGQALVTLGDRVIDEGIEQLRAEAEVAHKVSG